MKHNIKININILLILFLAIYPWYFSITGIDMTDTGYWLTLYQYFFDKPVILDHFAYLNWLTILFGHITNLLLGKFGLVAFMFANILTIYLMLWLVYKILHPYTTTTFLLLSLAVALVFIQIDRGYIINYNMLTTLFYILVAYIVHYSIVNKKTKLFFLAGFLLGLNMFIRLPNLLGIGIIIIIFYYDFIVNQINKETWKKSLYVILGYVSAIVLTLILMKSMGHLDFYIKSLEYIFLSHDTSASTHNTSSMLTRFIADQLYAFKYGFLNIVFIISIAWLSKFWNTKKYLTWLSLAILSIVYSYIIMRYSGVLYKPNYFFINSAIMGTVYWSLLFIIFGTYKKNYIISTLAFLIFIIIELIPLGSDTHLRNAYYGLYIGLPFILIYIHSLSSIHIGKINFEKENLIFLRNWILLTISIFSIVVSTVYFGSYCDDRVKWRMLYKVDHPKLAYKFTTKERTKSLNQLVGELKKIKKDYTYILTYNRVSTVQYLSDLKPYIQNSCPFFYTPSEIEDQLKDAKKLEKSLPVIIRAKRAVQLKSWPKFAPSIVGSKSSANVNKIRFIFEKFIKDNQYVTVWSSEDFEILTPTQR